MEINKHYKPGRFRPPTPTCQREPVVKQLPADHCLVLEIEIHILK